MDDVIPLGNISAMDKIFNNYLTSLLNAFIKYVELPKKPRVNCKV